MIAVIVLQDLLLYSQHFNQMENLEPDEVDKVFARTCSELHAVTCHLLIFFANSLDPDQADILSGLIWIQTV